MNEGILKDSKAESHLKKAQAEFSLMDSEDEHVIGEIN